MLEYFNPYFLSGEKKYIERGDYFEVDELQMFILNCEPEHGFISSETLIKFKFGLDKEKCLERINRADSEYAMNMVNMEERRMINPTDRGEEFSNLESENDFRFIMSDVLNPLSNSKKF